jgi:type II secretory pathway pseudopilin PulG
LLVTIAIIGVLIGMLVPAMQNMRELSRRSNCEQNLTQLSLAISNYALTYGHYPAGSIAANGPIRSEPKGFHHNWISALLPMLDAQVVYDAIDHSTSVYDKANDPVRSLRMPVLRCPSAANVRDNTTCYAGINASTETPIDVQGDGVFLLNRTISDDDISDGLAYTMFVGEKLSARSEDLGWISGTRSSLRNTGHAINAERVRIRGPQNPKNAIGVSYVGGLASDHPGGAYVLMGSGQYEFRSSSTDTTLLQQLADRADGSIPTEMRSREGLVRSGPNPAAQNGPTKANADAATATPEVNGDADAETPDETRADDDAAAEDKAGDTAETDAR